MAKYDVTEAHRVWRDLLSSMSPEQIIQETDMQLLDMIGFLLWDRLSEKDRTEEQKQKVVYASLWAAYIAGKQSVNEQEVANAFFEFVETMDIPALLDELGGDEPFSWLRNW